MRVQILVAAGHEYSLPAGRPKVFLIRTFPPAVNELPTLRSVLRFNFIAALSFMNNRTMTHQIFHVYRVCKLSLVSCVTWLGISLYIYFPIMREGGLQHKHFGHGKAPTAQAQQGPRLNPAVVLFNGPVINRAFGQFNVGFVILEVLDRDFI